MVPVPEIRWAPASRRAESVYEARRAGRSALGSGAVPPGAAPGDAAFAGATVAGSAAFARAAPSTKSTAPETASASLLRAATSSGGDRSRKRDHALIQEPIENAQCVETRHAADVEKLFDREPPVDERQQEPSSVIEREPFDLIVRYGHAHSLSGRSESREIHL